MESGGKFAVLAFPLESLDECQMFWHLGSCWAFSFLLTVDSVSVAYTELRSTVLLPPLQMKEQRDTTRAGETVVGYNVCLACRRPEFDSWHCT